MKRFRLLLLVAGSFAALLLVAALVVTSSGFQTWAVRRELAKRPDLGVTVANVDGGLSKVTLNEVRIVRDGAMLTLPTVEASLPVIAAAFSQRFDVSRLVAKGWTLDLSKWRGARTGAATATAPTTPANASAVAATAAGAAIQTFAGVFGQLRLPADVSLDGVQFEGRVVLPAARGRVQVALRGGGFGAGREGKLNVTADAALTDPTVKTVAIRGTVLGAMDTARTFTQVAVKFDAAAAGPQLPKEVNLTAGLTAAKAAMGESYSATLVSLDRRLLTLKAEFPRDASRLDGTWEIDVRDVDVASFTLGHPLPTFSAIGEGKFDTDASFTAVHATGRLNASASRLEVLQPELAAIGAVKVAASFDLASRESGIAIEQLEAAISSDQPIATVRALQGFAFNVKTGEVRASDPGRELVGVVLQGMPLAWLKPFLGGVRLEGGDLRGEVVATARGGGVGVKSRSPLAIDRLTVSQAGKPWLRNVDVAFGATADYTPQGWQAEISSFTARVAGTSALGFDVKAGRLAGSNQPLKTTGKFTANIPAVLQQPAAANLLTVTTGNASGDFVASVGQKTEVHGKLILEGLAAQAEGKPVTLPGVAAEIRADIAENGQIALNAPIILEQSGRKSDLKLVASIGPEKDRVRSVEAQVTSNHLVLDDAKLLAVMFPESKPATPMEKPNAPWSGYAGTVALDLKKVIYSEAFEVTNVAGRLRLDPGVVKLETVQMGLGAGGQATMSGSLRFDHKADMPYAMVADIAVKDFDPGPLFTIVNAELPPTVEGLFAVTSKLTATARSLTELASRLGGEFQLTSRGGIFRGLPVNATTLAENTSKFATWLASAGSALGLTGRKQYDDIANRAQAVSEVAKTMSAIHYDQLSVQLTRDGNLNTTLRDFTLISPEIRLTGGGSATHTPETSFLEDGIDMEFQLRARGRQGDLLRYLGALETQTDDLGYSACTLPLKIGGTIGKPDTTELNGKLAALALEKSGVTEKASELFNRIIGAGK